MNNIELKQRTPSDLINSLEEQHRFLKRSCKLYDDGSEEEAKRIALCIRILLHDTKSSKSVLEQLCIKQTIKFLDTAHPYMQNNLISSSCLTGIDIVSDGKNCSAAVYPLLKEYKRSNYVDFSTWWEAVVISDRIKKFSRKDIVLLVSNTDGGAHVDPRIPENYYDLTRNNSMGFILSIDGVEKPVKDFCLASLRQIGLEMDLTLDGLNIDLWKY
jgi:hypothetical protein